MMVDALASAPVDTEPLPLELEAALDQRIADVRSGAPMTPHAEVRAGVECRMRMVAVDALASVAATAIVGIVFAVAYVVTERRWLRRSRRHW